MNNSFKLSFAQQQRLELILAIFLIIATSPIAILPMLHWWVTPIDTIFATEVIFSVSPKFFAIVAVFAILNQAWPIDWSREWI